MRERPSIRYLAHIRIDTELGPIYVNLLPPQTPFKESGDDKWITYKAYPPQFRMPDGTPTYEGVEHDSLDDAIRLFSKWAMDLTTWLNEGQIEIAPRQF